MSDDPERMEEQTPPSPGVEGPTKEERTLALVAHAGGLFVSFIPPLVILLVKGDESEFVRDQAKEALNFQITMAIAMIVASGLVFLAIGCVLLPILGIADLVLCLIAALKSYEGQRYRYPWTLRLID